MNIKDIQFHTILTQVEAMGRMYNATLHMKTPFDQENNRIQGNYEDGLLPVVQQQRLLEYQDICKQAVGVRYLHSSQQTSCLLYTSDAADE